LFAAEDKGSFNNNDVTWLDVLIRLKPDLVELVVNREIERLSLAKLINPPLDRFKRKT